MKRILLLGLFSLLCTSCINGSRDLEVPKSEHLYLNAISSVFSTEIKVEAGITQLIIGGSAIKESNIELSVLRNNEPVKVEKAGLSYTLKLGKRLNTGDNITLFARSDKLSTVVAECNVLETPNLFSAKGEWNLSEDDISRVQVKLSIEPTNEVTYYRVIVRTDWYSKTLGIPPGDLIERQIITLGNPLFPQPKDQLFNEASNAPFALFSLQKESELTFSYYDVKIGNLRNAPFQMDWEYSAEVELQRISKDYYLYLLNCMDSENNNAFENPVKVHSNINGGFGIFEIYSPAVMSIEIEK